MVGGVSFYSLSRFAVGIAALFLRGLLAKHCSKSNDSVMIVITTYGGDLCRKYLQAFSFP